MINRCAIVKLLIERGANVSLPGRNGITPLSAAAYMGSVPIIADMVVIMMGRKRIMAAS